MLTLALGSMRLKNSLLASFTAAGPWSLNCEDGKAITAYCVQEGEFWFAPTQGEHILLQPGDILLLPEWREHLLCTSLAVPSMTITEAARARGLEIWDPDNPLGEIICIDHDAGAIRTEPTRLLSLSFRATEDEHRMLTGCLPSTARFSAGQGGLNPFIALAIGFMSQEAVNRSVGYGAATHKLAEFLFIQLLRAVVENQPDEVKGWLKGLTVPAISRALMEVHKTPDRRWTLAALADVARMSRSKFAAQFAQVVGVPPMTYVSGVRMRVAASRLGDGMTVQEVAAAAGYAAPFGFHQAFKKHYGVPPGRWSKT